MCIIITIIIIIITIIIIILYLSPVKCKLFSTVTITFFL